MIFDAQWPEQFPFHNSDVVSAEEYYARVEELAKRIEQLTEENQELQRQVLIAAEGATALCTRRMLQQTGVIDQLIEKVRDLGQRVEEIAWRKRTIDSEKECVVCGVLQSAFGGYHAPRCWIAILLEATKVHAKPDLAWRAPNP